MKVSAQQSRRDFLRLGALAGAGSLLAACATVAPGAAGDEEAPDAAATTISWWNPDVLDWQPAYIDMAAAFTEQNPDIQVEVQDVPEGGFAEKILSMIAGDTGPDVWVFYYATDFARRGFTEDITPMLEGDAIQAEEMWFPICIERATYEGRMYSTPRDGVWGMVGYNASLFGEMGVPLPEEGWTIDDYLAACIALTDEELGTWGTLISGPGTLLWDQAFCWNMGFEIVSENGRQVQGLLDTPTSIEAIQWVLDLQVEHQVAPSGAQSEALGPFAFGSGKVGMFQASGWNLVDLKEVPFEWDMVSVPIREGGESFAWGDSVQYYMWTGSQEKEASWELMKYISGVEGSQIAAEVGAWTPPTPQTWLNLGWDQDPILSKFWEQAQLPTAVPNYLRTEFHWDCVHPQFEGIWTRYIENEERPLEALVQEAAAEAQACLDKSYAAS
ncbi:MAG: extracellular solute-binding protein [Caldilineaceae bacterium]|nr:extracellular solute-binding protein [Caldilineaceae bacterium]